MFNDAKEVFFRMLLIIVMYLKMRQNPLTRILVVVPFVASDLLFGLYKDFWFLSLSSNSKWR